MLGDMLGTATRTITTPESQFLHELILHYQLGSFSTTNEAVSWLIDHFRFAAWGLQASREELESAIDLHNPRATMEGIIGLYVQRVNPAKSDADVWIDHTPDNFKYYGLLKKLYPDAKFIHIVRDGRGVCDSFKGLDWGPNNAYSASRHWAERLQQALIAEYAEGENCQRVYFEKLVVEPEQNLKTLCAFIEIEYDTAMISGGGLVLPGFTTSQHKLVGKGPQASKAYEWKEHLSQQELRDFESYPFTRKLLEKMGYELYFSEKPELSKIWILNRYCHEFFYYIRNRVRHRKMEEQVADKYQKSYR